MWTALAILILVKAGWAEPHQPVSARQASNFLYSQLFAVGPFGFQSLGFNGSNFRTLQGTSNADNHKYQTLLPDYDTQRFYVANVGMSNPGIESYAYHSSNGSYEKIDYAAFQYLGPDVRRLTLGPKQESQNRLLLAGDFVSSIITAFELSQDGSLSSYKKISIDDMLSSLVGSVRVNNPQYGAGIDHIYLDPSGRYYVVLPRTYDYVMVFNTDLSLLATYPASSTPGKAGCLALNGVFWRPSETGTWRFIIVCARNGENSETAAFSQTVIALQLIYSPTAGLMFEYENRFKIYDGDSPPVQEPKKVESREILLARRTSTSAVADIYITSHLSGNTTEYITHLEVSEKDGRLAIQYRGLRSSGGRNTFSLAIDSTGTVLFNTNNWVGDESEGKGGLVAWSRDAATGELAASPSAKASELDLHGFFGKVQDYMNYGAWWVTPWAPPAR